MRVLLIIVGTILNALTLSGYLPARTSKLAPMLDQRSAASIPQQGATRPATESKTKKFTPPAQDVLESTVSFRGWMGENAVIRKEDILKDGGLRTSFFLLKPQTTWTRLRVSRKTANAHNDPPGLKEGRVLISDYVRKSEDPAITFMLDADPKQISALQEGTQQAVQATLKILMERREGRQTVLWKQTRWITNTVGESGMVYRPPDLRSAILSPNESALLVELIVGEKSEYVIVAVKRFRAG